MKNILKHIVNYQLVMGLLLNPLLPAFADDETPGDAPSSTSSSNKGSGLQLGKDILDVTTSLIGNISQNIAQQQSQIYEQAFDVSDCTGTAQHQRHCQKNAGANIQQCLNAKFTCRDEYFPECNDLHAKPNVIIPSFCRNQWLPGSAQAANDQQLISRYVEQIDQVVNIYENFSLETAKDNNFGLVCLNNRQEELSRALESREAQIDDLLLKLTAAQENFIEIAKGDLNTIDETTALLEGENGGNREKSARILEDNNVNFGDYFKGNQACLSYLAQKGNNSFNSVGKSSGLLGITDQLDNIANEKSSSGISPAEFTESRYSSLVTEIETLARDISNKTRNKDIDQLSSPESLLAGMSDNPVLQGAVNTTFQNTVTNHLQDLTDLQVKARSIGIENEGILTELLNPNANFSSQVTQLERKLKNDCLASQPNIQYLLSNLNNIEDSAGTDFANENAASSFKTFVDDKLKDPEISIEKKLELITSQYQKRGNSRYQVKVTQATVELGEVRGYAVDQYIKVMVENCQKIYQSNKNSNGYTGAATIQKLKDLRSSYEKRSVALAQNIEESIKSRVIHCNTSCSTNDGGVNQCSGGADRVNATGIAVCSAENFNTSSASFCAKNALSCSKNMRDCQESTKNVVDQLITKKDTAVKNYSTNLKKNKDDMKIILETALQLATFDGINIAEDFKVDFVPPTDLNLALQDGLEPKLLDGINVEDPYSYFEIMKDNLEKIKQSMADQKIAVLAKVDKHIDDQKQKYENAIAVLTRGTDNNPGPKQVCQQTANNYAEGQKTFGEQQQENSEKTAEYCAELRSVRYPIGGEPAGLTRDVINAAIRFGDVSVLNEIDDLDCSSSVDTAFVSNIHNTIKSGIEGDNADRYELAATPICAKKAQYDKLLGNNDFTEACDGTDYKAIYKLHAGVHADIDTYKKTNTCIPSSFGETSKVCHGQNNGTTRSYDSQNPGSPLDVYRSFASQVGTEGFAPIGN